MVIKRNFKKLYQEKVDPWNVKDASAAVYNTVLDVIREVKKEKFQKILDLGCGKGTFTSRLSNLAEKTIGVELSTTAVKYAQKHYSHIQFMTGDISHLENLGLSKKDFDLITVLDVLYYFHTKTIRNILDNIWDLLKDDGILVLRHWAPGGGYLTHSEWQELIEERFNIIKARFLDTQHSLLLCQKKFTNIVFTFDYETWQPLPKGKTINWEKDIFEPTEKLLDLADKYRAKLSFFAEMGEYYWCKKNLPVIAQRMEEQWKEIIKRGHDVQIHLHPIWLPECGARCDKEKKEWFWDDKYQRIHNAPINIEEILRRCKIDLERILKPVNSNYQAIVFRAGKYQIQPNKEIFEIFRKVGILADSSVWKGGYSQEHHFDFRKAYSYHQPYFASKYNINYLAPWGEAQILEIPIASNSKHRFLLDNHNFNFWKSFFSSITSVPKYIFLRFNLLPYQPNPFQNNLLNKIYNTFLKFLNKIDSFLNRNKNQKANYNEDLVITIIGHTKQNISTKELGKLFAYLKQNPAVQFKKISTIAQSYFQKLQTRKEQKYYAQHIKKQVDYDREAILGGQRNWQQSFYAQDKIPLDRKEILDLGCGADYWTKRLNDNIAKTVGIDVSGEFLARARQLYPDIEFKRMDFHKLEFPDSYFDCVYADNVLEHSPYPQKSLEEIYRVLSNKGFFIALIPSDARNPQFSGSDHVWKTDKDEIEQRLKEIGFSNIQIEDINVVKNFRMSPYLASNNSMLIITAWKWGNGYNALERSKDIMNFVYNSLGPERSQKSNDPREILKGGHAWCAGYVAVMKYMLQQEGFKVRHYTLYVKNHFHGRGGNKVDTHEILEVFINYKWMVFDPTANKYLSFDLKRLLSHPNLIDVATRTQKKDKRWYKYHYNLYCSSYFYKLIYKIQRH